MTAWPAAAASFATACLLLVAAGAAAAQETAGGEPAVNCSLTYFDPHCSPSGWLSFILGDVVIAVLLAVLLFHLSSKSYKKIDVTTRQIELVLNQEKESRKRRTLFICHTLKEEFGTILLGAGLINMKLKTVKPGDGIPAQVHEQISIQNRAITNARYSIGVGVDMLQPKLVSDMYELLSFLEANNPIKGASTGFPEYDRIKSSIYDFTEHLNAEILAVE